MRPAVPRDRQLIELTVGRLIDVNTRVMTGTEDVIDWLLEEIDRVAVGIILIAAEDQTSVAPDHLENLFRWCVDEFFSELFNEVVRSRTEKRARHSDVLIRARNLAVTCRAGGFVDIAGERGEEHEDREHELRTGYARIVAAGLVLLTLSFATMDSSH